MSTIRVIGSTMGVSSRATVRDDAANGDDGFYHYRKDRDWFPNDPRYYPGRAETPPETGPANARAMRNRKERILEYGRLQVEEGLTEDQAAERVGAFGRTTRRTYKQEWLALQRREGRDA